MRSTISSSASGPQRPACRWAAALCLGLVLALVLTLLGCGASVADRLAQLHQSMAKPDRAVALLQAKSLLQAHPNQPEARQLLGSLLLETGDPLAAETELRRALELGRGEPEVLPLLARALLASNQAGKLLLQFGQVELPAGRAAAQLKAALAEAEATLGDLEAARKSLSQALRADPDYEPARLLQARVSAVGGDLPAALSQVEAMLTRQSANADAWVLKGDLLSRLNAGAEAIAQAYQQALTVRADHANAHAALVGHYLAQDQADAARQQLAAMRKLLPKHPQTLLFEGQIALLDGDLARARERFQDLLRVLPEHVQVLQSAGAVELRLNAPVQAEVLLSKAVALAPDSLIARRLLAQSFLAQGQPERALGVLEPLLVRDRADAQALLLAAQSELLLERPAAAAALYDRAAGLKPEDPKIRIALALSRLARGQTEPALAELQAVATQDKGSTADMALIATQLRRKDFAAALRAIDALQGKQPGQPTAWHLRGQVLLQQRQLAQARQAFEQALTLDAGFFPSVGALVGLDFLDQQVDAARDRLLAFVKLRPQLAQPRLALAEIAARTGADRETVSAVLEAGIKANPTDASLRLALVDHHSGSFNPRAAIQAAQLGLAQLPQHFELLQRLGQAQLATAEHLQALTTFNAMATQQPRSPLGPMGLARAQLAGNDPGAAQRSIRRALELAPEDAQVQRLAIRIALRLSKPEQALAIARQQQQRQPDRAAGWLLEGDIQLAQQRWQAAVLALRQAVAKVDPQQAPARLHQALRQAGEQDQALAMATDWTRRHPRDALFRFYLGDVALAQKDLAAAETHYQAVLELMPEHGLALNNLAWLMLAQKRPGALPIAEHAVRVMPDQPALLDTLAQAQAAEQQPEQAVATQQRALRLAPDEPSLRLNLARYLAQAGDKRQAKAELDRLASLGERFPRQPEVAALLKSLGGR